MNIEVQIAQGSKYIAQDENGEWWQFSEFPTLTVEGGGWKGEYGSTATFAVTGVPPTDYTKEVYEIYYEYE